MKKNKMMRLASGLLVAVLITTSTISGTFAKYVTEGSAQDEARVAKFGVTVTATSELFDEDYDSFDTSIDADTDKLSVVSTSKVVAPGTENEEMITINVTGVPEVDVRVSIAFEDLGDANDDVFLNGTGLPDMTTADDTDTFGVTNYYPVKYTLKKGGTPVTGAEEVTLATLKTKMNEEFTKYYNAGDDLGTELGTYTISWKWDFYVDADTDKADTLLGDLMAGTAEAVTDTPADAYNLYTGLGFTITVEQVD